MTYPTHDTIATEIHKLVNAHVNFHAAHNRENLDDLIYDLIQYMQTLPTVGQYIDANEL